MTIRGPWLSILRTKAIKWETHSWNERVRVRTHLFLLRSNEARNMCVKSQRAHSIRRTQRTSMWPWGLSLYFAKLPNPQTKYWLWVSHSHSATALLHLLTVTVQIVFVCSSPKLPIKSGFYFSSPQRAHLFIFIGRWVPIRERLRDYWTKVCTTIGAGMATL